MQFFKHLYLQENEQKRNYNSERLFLLFALSVSGNLPKGYGEYMKKGCIVLSLPSLVTQY